MVSWLTIALFAWLFRYFRLIINCISHWTFRPIPIPEHPTYTSQDVTIIIPTISDGGQQLLDTIRTCLQSQPYELILVTIDANVDALSKLVYAMIPSRKKIRILSIKEANKRRQMCRAIPQVMTKITLFVDDDVIWPPKVLDWILAPFEDELVGGVGTSQRLKRPAKMSVWGFLGAAYLERRNFDCSACLGIDGGLPCLSGRTVAYRSSILQHEDFQYSFTNEEWMTCQLNADDDNFITRWMYSHQWKIAMQYHRDAEIQTVLEDSPKYLWQCLRWVRSNWRSNLTSLFVERHYWWSQPWTTYSVLQTTITAWALPFDALIFYAWYQASESWTSENRQTLFIALLAWTFLFSKTVKLWGHFARYPADIFFMPAYILFGWFHGFIKFYGLLTLHATTWGSREGADADNSVRMIRLPRYGSSEPDGRKSDTFYYDDDTSEREYLPAYEGDNGHNRATSHPSHACPSASTHLSSATLSTPIITTAEHYD